MGTYSHLPPVGSNTVAKTRLESTSCAFTSTQAQGCRLVRVVRRHDLGSGLRASGVTGLAVGPELSFGSQEIIRSHHHHVVLGFFLLYQKSSVGPAHKFSNGLRQLPLRSDSMPQKT